MKENICQSCAMPLTKDPQGGGTNADGTISTLYCSHCYQNGTFLFECNDVKQFQEHCRKIMRKNGMNPVLSWIFSRGYSRLERWKKR